jgi:hypothetical protein
MFIILCLGDIVLRIGSGDKLHFIYCGIGFCWFLI